MLAVLTLFRKKDHAPEHLCILGSYNVVYSVYTSFRLTISVKPILDVFSSSHSVYTSFCLTIYACAAGILDVCSSSPQDFKITPRSKHISKR